ncbi:MAG TPA: hypothetical protein VGN57_05575 [Pirellulaceae bacterium]|jgi:hypothetical protein|nr:hypothetical protein [Pirellulaceae bacterium]
MARRNRRHKLFIEPKVQGPLMFRVAAYWMAMLWAAAVMLIGAPYAVGVALSQQPPEFLEIASRVCSQLWPAFFVAAMMLPIVLMDILRQSHRMVGPTLRIRRALQDLADGKTIDPIYFRKGDYWAISGEAINRIQENLLAATSPAMAPPKFDSSPLTAPPNFAGATPKQDPKMTLVLPISRRQESEPDEESALDEPLAFDRETIVLSELRSLQRESQTVVLGEGSAPEDRLDVGNLLEKADSSDGVCRETLDFTTLCRRED